VSEFKGPAPTGASEIETLIHLLSRLPGLGPRSARRAALHLIKRRDSLMLPLTEALATAAERIKPCTTCNDLWAIERTGAFKGRYHVLGGTLSALDGVGPDDLAIVSLLSRLRAGGVDEIILALNATVDGQTTAHYLADRLADANVTVTRLAHGVPVGGELDYLDDGTLSAALAARRNVG
jgi:recombination protein RecR